MSVLNAEHDVCSEYKLCARATLFAYNSRSANRIEGASLYVDVSVSKRFSCIISRKEYSFHNQERNRRRMALGTTYRVKFNWVL
jgi:hypothetical protein